MKTLPQGMTAYKRTPEFTESTVPAGLLQAHNTRAGVWAKIEVLSGSLLYRILESAIEEVPLAPGTFGVIEPGVRHHVIPGESVRFFVEFYHSA